MFRYGQRHKVPTSTGVVVHFHTNCLGTGPQYVSSPKVCCVCGLTCPFHYFLFIRLQIYAKDEAGWLRSHCMNDGVLGVLATSSSILWDFTTSLMSALVIRHTTVVIEVIVSLGGSKGRPGFGAKLPYIWQKEDIWANKS